MTMFSVFVEVEPSPLAETTCVDEKQVADWLKEKFELYKDVPGEIIFRVQRLEDKGIDPDVPESEEKSNVVTMTSPPTDLELMVALVNKVMEDV